jgi:hypothetical protein
LGTDRLIDIAKSNYFNFIKSCQIGPVSFGLTPRAEATVYACCFAVFGFHLLLKQDVLEKLRSDLVVTIRNGVRTARSQYPEVPSDKPYRQLLAFSLSALSILNVLEEDPLPELLSEQLIDDVEVVLTKTGALEGRPQSGNHAMFYAIFLIHARDYLGLDVESQLDHWVELHQQHMNRFGYWGSGKAMRHLQFQNGYHQHEIYEYLGVSNPQINSTVEATLALADFQGHFAPYPGGGGCYDYDAVFMLTPEGRMPDPSTEDILCLTIDTLLSEQTVEGGWGESCLVRPRNLKQFWRFISHVACSFPNLDLFYERLRYALALQSFKHNRIHTHWSRYSRCWDEANLWDSWFRMLAIARVQVALDPTLGRQWGFIDFPGIGYHPSLRKGWSKV